MDDILATPQFTVLFESIQRWKNGDLSKSQVLESVGKYWNQDVVNELDEFLKENEDKFSKN